MDYIKLSKEIAYALRHAPWEYELEMDELGFVRIEQLLLSINETNKYKKEINVDDLFQVMRVMEKERFEIVDDKIRALYGHSNTLTIQKEKGIPPQTLYHGTTHQAIDIILKTGLKPMSRQYVHLSVDIDTAYLVGKRRDENPILLEIDTLRAMEDGICFYQGNDKVWLCNELPLKYIKILKN